MKNVRASNKRIRKQQHLLDVKIRKTKEQSRVFWSIFWGTCKCVLALALIVGGYIGGKRGLQVYVWENPDYMLSEIRYSTDGTLTRADVLGVSGLVEGTNILLVDIAAARDAINALPQVDRVEVQRQFPSRVAIKVAERKPIAWVTRRAEEDPSTSATAFLIDARSIAMKPRGVLQQYIHLPIISGFPVENLADGHRAANYEIQAALELVRLNAENTKWQITNIDVSRGYCLNVTDNRRIQITFHIDRLEQQLDRLNRLFDRIGERQRELQTVNLFGERNTYLTYAEPVPEAAPEAATPPAAAVKAASGKTPSAATPRSSTPVPATSSRRAKRSTPTPTPAPKKGKSGTDSLRKPFRTDGQG